MNPRYVAYAKQNGNTPEQQILVDRKEYPGGLMAGFISWMLQMRRKFAQECPEFVALGGDVITNQVEYTKWLSEKAENRSTR